MHLLQLSEDTVTCSVTVHLIPSTQDLSLDLELGWQPASPQDPLSSCHSTGVTVTRVTLLFSWAIQTQVLTLVGQMPTEPAPQSHISTASSRVCQSCSAALRVNLPGLCGSCIIVLRKVKI